MSGVLVHQASLLPDVSACADPLLSACARCTEPLLSACARAGKNAFTNFLPDIISGYVQLRNVYLHLLRDSNENSDSGDIELALMTRSSEDLPDPDQDWTLVDPDLV